MLHITKFDAKGTEVLVCYPEGSLREYSALQTNFTAPNYMVFADKAQFDETYAAEIAGALGLDRAAAAGGGLLLFVRGRGESWVPEDLAAFDSVLSCMNPDTSSVYNYGIGIGRSFRTGAEEKRIVGFPGTIHVIGIGAGADFVGKNMLRALPVERIHKPGAMISNDHSPASVLLINASELPAPDPTVIPDSPEYQVTLRVAALNCPEGTDKALSVLGCGNWTVLRSGCSKTGVSILIDGFCSRFLRQAEQLVPVPDWEKEGIVCRTETREVPTAPNSGSPALTHSISYNLYYPAGLDLVNERVPLMLTFHGGGNAALFMALTTQWPQIAKENRMMIAAVDRHTNIPAEEVMALITALRQDYPCIDAGKLYANGYSMGAVKCWELIEKYPAVFAGVAPMHGSFAARQGEVPAFRTPVFYIGGELSSLPEFPCQGENLRQRVEYVLKVNGVPVDYQPDYEVNRWWGVNGSRREEIPDPVTYKNSVLTVEYFDSDDGRCLTALSGGSNEGHEVYDRNCRAAWKFLSKFRRMPDGSIAIE